MNKTTKIFRCIFICILVFAIFLIFLKLERPIQPGHLKTSYDVNNKIVTIENFSSKQTNFFTNLKCQVYIDELNYKNLEFDIGPQEKIEFDLTDHFSEKLLEKKSMQIKIKDSTTFLGGTIVLILAIAIIFTSLIILLKKI